jgi:hypothetical protein
MISSCLRIANAQGFWGDRPKAAARLLAADPAIDFVTLDYLAELTMSIMAAQRSKDATLGYATDFPEVLRSLVPYWKAGGRARVIADAGGMNPGSCAESCIRTLQREGLAGTRVGVVTGDDVTSLLRADASHTLFRNMETGEPLTLVLDRLISANAYLGAAEAVALLDTGAEIVVTGRISDPSLTVAPCVHHFGWHWDNYEAIAGATVAGHLIECGSQVTGGISTDWLSLPKQPDLGFPIAEMEEDGSCIITKPEGTGGAVSACTIKEQLLYEIGDPARYLSPDVSVSLLGISISEVSPNRVRVIGAGGVARPPTLKVSAAYHAGWKSEAMVAVFGHQAGQKARATGELVLQRVADEGFLLQHSLLECIGNGDVVPGLFPPPADLRECILRIAVADIRREAVECFTKEIAPLVTSGPQGLTGYSGGRPKVRPVIAYWPCLIERAMVQPRTEILVA